MESLVSSMSPDGLMSTTDNPARSALVVVEMHALGSKLPDVDLCNPKHRFLLAKFESLPGNCRSTPGLRPEI